jgi:hypothetical protein
MSHLAANESIVLTLTIPEVCPVAADVAAARCSRTSRISVGRKGGADRRQPHRAARPYHQLHAEVILEVADGAAHGTMGHVQLVGRSGKAQVTGRCLKARQRI